MTNLVVAQSNNPQEPSRSVNNPPSKMQIIRSSVQDSAMSAVTKHPILTSGAVVLGAAVANWLSCGAGIALTLLLGGYLVHREYSSPEQLAQRLEKQCKGLNFEQGVELIAQHVGNLPTPVLEKLIAAFVENHWESFNLPDYCNNPENKQFFTDKLVDALKRGVSLGNKRSLCKSEVSNLKNMINTLHERITSDLQDEGFQNAFNINPGSSVAKIKLLQEGTHDRKSIAISIEITDSQTSATRTLIYKPHPIVQEEEMYGKGGLLESLGQAPCEIFAKEEYGYLQQSEYLPSEQLLPALEQGCKEQGIPEGINILARGSAHLPAPFLRNLVKTFVESNWEKFGFPGYCNNEKNKSVLIEKLFSILNNDNYSVKDRLIVCENVINNFNNLIQTFNKRALSDLQENDFQKLFGVSPGSHISKIEILGEETHNKGNVPILIEVTDSETQQIRKIVYKPRSTFPEQALYGQGGLFASLEGHTYGVLSRERYGYCEFLENREGENTLTTQGELQSYARSIIILEKVARQLGLSDLHSDNIITSRKYPFVIDAETVLLPTENQTYNTELLTGFRAGYMFEPDVTKNRIWSPIPKVHQALTQAITTAREDESIDELIQTRTEEIESCKKTLSQEGHRIVLVSTDELKAQFRDGLERGREDFMRNLEGGLERWGFTPNKGIWQEVGKRFAEDFMNDDIPVFYYDPTSKEVFYYDISLGRQP